MPGISDTPDNQFVINPVPAEPTAANAGSWPVWRAPFNAVIVAARWIPAAAVTGVATNNFALTVNNKTTVGAVTAVKTYAAGTNSVASTPESLTLSTAAGVNVNTGDVIALDRTVNGTGLASPTGVVELTYRWR